MIHALAIFIGYILGSLNPAFFFGKILKQIDIRDHGTKNAGTTNAKNLLGFWPAAMTAIFDVAKGLAAIEIAFAFGVPAEFAYLAGLAAIVGHVFPFYLGFRGGQGMATSVGLLFYLAIKLGLAGAIGWQGFLPALSVLIFAVLAIIYIMRDTRAIGILVLPAFIVFLLANTRRDIELYFLLLLLLYMIAINILVLFQQKVFNLEITDDKTEHLLNWRTFARPLAVILVVFLFRLPKFFDLYLIGGLALVFILIDLIRLLSQRANQVIFSWRGFLKEKDRRRFSSMTQFLSAVFLIVLVFPADIAGLSVIFLIFGDLAAKFFGIFYSKTKILDRSVEGTLAHFTFSLLAGAIFIQFVPLPYYLLILGAATAALTDLFTIFGIDDNFTVGLISAAVMQAVRTFV
ncbi:MAG: glycerol-3-phosphate acyltransferase [Candidatus Berkelbacteria bacterium]|nr:glycerol-3-phosphate acyltransferase [Candidatus Berkelbacteria bacterium]